MSIMAESNVYESMADDGLSEKLCLTACGASGAYMFIPKIERHVEEVMRNVSEEIVEEQADILQDGIIQDTYATMEQPPVYYEEALSTCEEVEVDYKPSLTSMMLPVNKMEEQWGEAREFDGCPMDSSLDETEEVTYHQEDLKNVEDSDEETIATFLTSAGQRLALYAVEDSDEVFAVAVYDESGEPPTNFQFLMKSDVERLIGEGAVRTVKKPSQIKKQLFSTEPPIFAQHTVETSIEEKSEMKIDLVQPTECQNNQYDTHNTLPSEDADFSNTEIVQDTEIKSSPSPDLNKQPHYSYVLMESDSAAIDATDRIEEMPATQLEETTEENESTEFIEQSTVQYMLLGNDESDDDLTFADIEETLKNHRTNDDNESLLKKREKTSLDSPDDHQNLNGTPNSEATQEDLQNFNITFNGDRTENSQNSLKTCGDLSHPKKASNLLISKRENTTDERQNNVSSGMSLLIANAEAKGATDASGLSEASQTVSKVKRSRKQQLTSVNREDSEIIIQPASFPSEEDEPIKKRGRGKRKPGRPAIYKTAKAVAKKVMRSQRPRPVEVIEIDVDEEDHVQGKKDVVEITLDDNKEKGSSDKENEVIMVGDSDDEEQEAAASKSSSSILKCDHCLRSFRQKRALETHSRVCPKSPDAIRRLTEKSAQRRNSSRSNDSPAVKKEYSCKVCQEKFDVVVALARHVRSMHSQRKKINSSLQTAARAATPEKSTEPPKADESVKKSPPNEIVAPASPRRRRTKTKIKPAKRSWKSRKLHCADCGKWFSSEALLTAHSLQHATKKSEKQTRRCQTCKKIFKSRLLYIRHMRMHSRVKQLQKKLHHTRQSTGKTTALRKRGRPRKL